jgi:lactate dehydrogenase-like 2-hydroxyacid dehydrogenase
MWYRFAQKQLPKVLLAQLDSNLWGIVEKDLEPIKKLADLTVLNLKSMTETELANKCKDFDYLMLNMDFLPSYPNKMEKLTEKFYNNPNIKNLKLINVDMTDADFFSPSLCKEKNILLQTCPNAVTNSVAESTVTEILLHARNRHLAYQDLINDKDQECRDSVDLKGKTAGIIGYGNIGKSVAKTLKALGMNILYYDADNSNATLEEIFKKSKVITIHIPAIKNNKQNTSNLNLIDKKLLDLCNETILINLATDIIVDTNDLIKAIKSNKISGYSVEPGRKITEKLKKYPQVHISPCSYDSPESRDNVKKLWIDNMISALENKPENVWLGTK